MNSKPQKPEEEKKAKEKRFTKEKVKKTMPKVLGFAVIVAISVAFSDVSFAQLGHDFFMKFFDFALQEEDEGQYLYTLPPSEERAELMKEAAGTQTPGTDENEAEEDAAAASDHTDAVNGDETEAPPSNEAAAEEEADE